MSDEILLSFTQTDSSRLSEIWVELSVSRVLHFLTELFTSFFKQSLLSFHIHLSHFSLSFHYLLSLALNALLVYIRKISAIKFSQHWVACFAQKLNAVSLFSIDSNSQLNSSTKVFSFGKVFLAQLTKSRFWVGNCSPTTLAFHFIYFDVSGWIVARIAYRIKWISLL